jgi:enterochelin esterase family protein
MVHGKMKMMKITSVFLPLLLVLTSGVESQMFDDFLAQLNAAPADQRPALVDSFMEATSAFPVVEQDTLAHFICRGSAQSVSVPGDADAWTIGASPMTLVAGTDFWYRTDAYESDARLDYKFVLNGSTWILDPLNPNTVLGGFGPNSELRMPAYQPPSEINYYPDIPHGTLQDTVFHSTNMGNSRTIRVYLPPDYGISLDRYPIILFHDGLEYISLANADHIIDYLIHWGHIVPLIAVFVPPVNRNQEYAGSLQNQFTSFIVEEVIPWVDARFRTLSGPENRAVLGASNGGNISLWLGLQHSEIFGNVAAQSSYIQSSISDGFQNGPTLDMKIYLDLGTYDLPLLVPLVRNFVPILEEKEYIYQYREYHEGHSWGFWRAHIDDALEMFFPAGQSPAQPSPSGEPIDKIPGGYRLHQNCPNPFNSGTRIEFILEKAAVVSLAVYNIVGQRIRSLMEQYVLPGRHQVSWNGEKQGGGRLSSGVYFCRLMIDGRFVDARRMVLLR